LKHSSIPVCFSSAILLAQNLQAMLKFDKFWIIITKTAWYWSRWQLLKGDNRYNDLFPNDIAEPYLKNNMILHQISKQLASLIENKLIQLKISFDIVSLK
jgi:hypothetical protein